MPPSSTTTKPPIGSWMQQSETLLSFGMLVGLIVMLVPIPEWLLDVLLASNLAATTLLLLVTLSARRALELTVFPSLLLLLTLYRLSLNVATTRLILLDGNAGHIVTAFGNYVVGGQLVVTGHLFDPSDHPVHGDYERCRTNRRSRRPIYTRRDARQADGN